MSFTADAKMSLIKYNPLWSGNGGNWNFPARKMSESLKAGNTELWVRLNELANARPFNIQHRVKRHDPL